MYPPVPGPGEVESVLLYPAAPITLVEAVRAEQAGAWTKKPIQVPTWGLGDVGITFAAWFFLSMVAGIAAFAITDGAGVSAALKGLITIFAVMIPWIGMGGWPLLATSTKGNGPSIDLGLRWSMRDIAWGLMYGVIALVTAVILGAVTTAVTLLVVLLEKFRDGAWLTVIVIPAFTLGFGQIRHHYRAVASQLSLRGLPPSLKPFPAPRVVIPISGIHRGIVDALGFARTIAQDITAVYVELEPGMGAHIQQEWEVWWPDVPLVVVPSPYRSLVGPLLDYLDATDNEHHDGQLAVVILPEFVPAKRWHGILHNQTARLLKVALLYRRRRQGFQRVIIDVPYHLRR